MLMIFVPVMDALKDVNPYLSELQHLTYLDLSRLYIHPIPEFLGSMQRLRYLSLQGGEGDAIPIPSSSISNLTNLRALYLDDFTFKNLTASTWLAPLSSLQYLNLKDMDLPMNLYKVLNMLPSLLHLYLSYYNFAKVSYFPLTNLTCLQLLSLASNLFNCHSSVLHAFQNTTSIKVLDISGNDLNSVPSWGCGFAGELPSTLQNMTSIRSLDFSQNSLSSIVPLGKLENLVKLNLESNHLYGPLHYALRNLTFLTHLRLFNNHFNSLPLWLGELKSLVRVDLFLNNSTVTTIEEGFLSSILKNFYHLKYLDFSGSNCQGLAFNDKGTLSSCNGYALEYLQLNVNKFGGLLPSKIPERIGDMRSLESIDLSHNHLSGAIPRNMIDLNLLSHLNLSYNNLSGSIPIENQFQTLNDPLSYTSNQYLSGAPLPKYYPGDGPHHVPTFEGYEDEDRKNDQLEKAFFYSIVSIGFVTGFWGNY
ncbi:hypothetical protein Ahy_A07g033649 [Arachis hypogaea]|uniref:LRR receptor-like serine/threonine-protein kinase n=1 Tax=Arachis hypogaea TaxID=3818 RepID=A0A445C9T3_ARAHY|nr:hypothetical protein Ahy_A07g033649 [Arachis hypogaea]